MALDRKTHRISTRLRKTQTHIKKNITDEQQASTTTILEGVKSVNVSGSGTSKRGSKKQHLVSMSLAVKFAAVISLVAALLCLISQIVVYYQTESALLWEVDRKGATLVKTIASLAQQYVLEMETLQQPGTKPGSVDKEIAQIKGKYIEYLEAIQFYDTNKQYSDEIFNITLLSSIGTIPNLQVGQEQATELQGRPRQFLVKNGMDSGIVVIDGRITSANKTIEVQTYKCNAVPNKIDVLVMLSSQEIADTTNSLVINIVITTFIAIVLGIIISILLANEVTKPVRQLMRDIETVAQGNLNHTTSATSKDEIGQLARTFNIMTQSLKSAHETELANQAREHELKVAKDIQSNLLPSQIPQIDSYNLASYYHPAKEVGGDYYDFIEIDSDHLGIVIADVSGKSIPGSMLMTMTRALLRMEAVRNNSPARTFAEVNRILAKDITRGMFVTAMYGILQISSHQLTLSSAGHNPIVVARAQSGENEMINPKGMALGLDKGNIFNKTIRDQTITLWPGDRVIFYTDGVPEAMSPQKEEWGDDRFLALISKTAGKDSKIVVDLLVQTLIQWRGRSEQSDDITIVAFQRNR